MEWLAAVCHAKEEEKAGRATREGSKAMERMQSDAREGTRGVREGPVAG
jgi:hypothetical protein